MYTITRYEQLLEEEEERCAYEAVDGVEVDGMIVPRYKMPDDAPISALIKYDAPLGWLDLFRMFEPESRRLDGLGDFLPGRQNLFRAFTLTPLDRVRVVIVGQDPYPTRGHADGLAFSYSGDGKIPRSLQNIKREIQDEYPGVKFSEGGDLSGWARQGVLLINKCLTVQEGKAGSHRRAWDPFIKMCFKYIQERRPRTIFVMWGRVAQQTQEYLTSGARVLEAPHPSPMAGGKFFGCGHFKQINEYLESISEEPIDWSF